MQMPDKHHPIWVALGLMILGACIFPFWFNMVHAIGLGFFARRAQEERQLGEELKRFL